MNPLRKPPMTTSIQPTHGTSDTLQILLDNQLRLPPEYQDQLTNHLPMALHALHRLGASPARIQAFYAFYADRFAARPEAAEAEPVDDWQALLGQPDAHPVLQASMARLLARHGTDATLCLVLPVLLPGAAAAALHGPIRTAHAVESGHTGELAAALAYWAWRWQPLVAPSSPAPALPLAEWAARLVRQAQNWATTGPLISIRMEEATHSPTYQALAGSLQAAPDVPTRIAELAGLAVQSYASNPNFTVLHMMTGLRALRMLLPWLGGADSAGAQAVLARVVTAAYPAARVKDLPVVPEPRFHSWPEVIAAAIASEDEHVIKLVDTCREEPGVYGEGQYLRVAGLAVL